MKKVGLAKIGLSGFLLTLMIVCKSRQEDIVYFTGVPRIAISTDYPRWQNQFTVGTVLFTASKTLDTIDFTKIRHFTHAANHNVIGRYIIASVKDYDCSDYLVDEKYKIRGVDSIVNQSVELELMNFLINYYDGTDSQRIAKTFIKMDMNFSSNDYKIANKTELLNTLADRFSNAARDTIEMMCSDLKKNVNAYQTVGIEGHLLPRFPKPKITAHTFFAMPKYKREFAFTHYCAFQAAFEIMKEIAKNEYNPYVIYTYFNYNNSYRRKHNRNEYTDVFTAYYLEKKDNGHFIIKKKILNPDNINRIDES